MPPPLSPIYPDLQGKVAVVTGGAQGIGAAIAEAFVQNGMIVHFGDIDDERGAALAARLGPTAKYSHADVTQAQQVAEWVKRIGAEHGTLDVLVNNAASDRRIRLENLSTREWDELLALNLRSHFLLARESLPYLRAGSSIINLGSVTYHVGYAELSGYIASKGGIVGLTRGLARELGPRGVRVNCLAPGWTMTERQLRDHVTPETQAWVKGIQCLPELLQPEEIAHVALFLASQASSAITGQIILADKGWAHD